MYVVDNSTHIWRIDYCSTKLRIVIASLSSITADYVGLECSRHSVRPERNATAVAMVRQSPRAVRMLTCDEWLRMESRDTPFGRASLSK